MWNIEFGGSKKRGRPMNRWSGEVQEHMKEIGLENWKEAARDRKK